MNHLPISPPTPWDHLPHTQKPYPLRPIETFLQKVSRVFPFFAICRRTRAPTDPKQSPIDSPTCPPHLPLSDPDPFPRFYFALPPGFARRYHHWIALEKWCSPQYPTTPWIASVTELWHVLYRVTTVCNNLHTMVTLGLVSGNSITVHWYQGVTKHALPAVRRLPSYQRPPPELPLGDHPLSMALLWYHITRW